MGGTVMPAPESKSVPSDAELVAFAGEEQFLLFCDKDEFVQIARAVLQRFATPAPVSGGEGWQPIETAPRDARQLLLCKAGASHAFVGYWRHAIGGWRQSGTIAKRDPTHWQPMPKPAALTPQQDTGGEG